MKLQDCLLNVDLFVSAPLTRSQPEEDWERSRSVAAIPESLFELYRRANYLSFGASPKFLRDQTNVLFEYFGMVMRGLMESLSDAQSQLDLFMGAQALVYDQGKVARGEHWEPDAAFKARRHLRDLLNSLQAALDGFSDLVAIVFTGFIPRLCVGRAQFVSIDSWLKDPLPPFGIVIRPYDEPIRKLHDVLRPLVHASGPERQWLPLMRMLRNKVAHLSPATFRSVGLHDTSGRFYEFVPRQWPFLWEEHMRRAESDTPPDPMFFPKFFERTLVRQDIESYVQGLRRKVLDVVGGGVSVVSSTYMQVADFDLNSAALAELQANSLFFEFEYFPDTVVGAVSKT